MEGLEFQWLDMPEFQNYKEDSNVSKMITAVNSWANINKLTPPDFEGFNSVVILAILNKIPIGFLQYYCFADDLTSKFDECYISWIFTNPENRKEGIASALLDELISYFKIIPECASISSAILENNLASINLHKKFGFNQTQEFPFEISEDLKDRIVTYRLELK